MKNFDAYPKVSVIILNYIRPKETIECVQSVLKSDYPNLEVIVVDNSSNDPQFNFLQKKLNPLNVLLIKTRSNLEYAGGNNFGIRHSTGEYIFILNDDVIIDSNLINGLVKIAQKYATIGIIGPVIYRYGSNDVWFYSQNIKYKTSEVLDVPIVVGSALMIKREVIYKIGLLDENFFMYHEELDWCIRARKAGYRTVCATKLKAWHKVPEDETIKDYSPYKAYFFHRNFFLIAGKHCKNIRTAFKFLFKHLVYYGGHSFPCYFVVDALRKMKIDALRAYLRAYFDGIIFFLKFRLKCPDYISYR